MRRRLLNLAFLVVWGALLGLVSAGTGPGVAGAEEASSHTTVQTVGVKRGPLGATVSAKGVLEALRHEAASCKPEVYAGPFKIAEVSKEGRVVEGQVLVRFEEDEYVKQLADRERGLVIARNRLEKKEHEFQLRKREGAVSMDESIRRKQQADQALERYLKFERKTKEQEALLRFQGSRDRIKDQQEELEQLEKMYNEDDLTEETEEIVLNRARRGLERSLKYFSFQKNRHDYNMEVLLPRELEKLRIRQRQAANVLDRLQATQPLDLKKADLDMAQARRDFKKSEESLEKFRADRASLSVKAPMAGHAVAGSLSGGKWSGLGSLESTLQVGKKVKARQVLFTVVDDSVLRVRTSVKEGDVLQLASNSTATVTCGLTGKDKFEAVVESIARYGAGGNHTVLLRLSAQDKRLRSGLACKISLPKSQAKDVLSVPEGSILDEDGTCYVFVRDGDGAVTKTKIEVGEKAAGRVEVVTGLKAGQRLLKSPPQIESAPDESAPDESAPDEAAPDEAVPGKKSPGKTGAHQKDSAK